MVLVVTAWGRRGFKFIHISLYTILIFKPSLTPKYPSPPPTPLLPSLRLKPKHKIDGYRGGYGCACEDGYIIIQLRTKMLLVRLFSNRSTFFRVGFGMSKSKKDFYQILGVGRDASQADIKKAYYKLAQELHPDKNSSPSAKDRFAEINNAYQTLSDQAKRKNYDQTGSTEENPYQGFENEDIFSNMRGGFGGFNGRRGQQPNMEDFQTIFEDLFGGAVGGGSRKSRRGGNAAANEYSEDITLKYDIDFSEAVHGSSKVIELRRRCTCSVCKGSRAKPGTKPQKCHHCQGTGSMTFHQGIMVVQSECPSCQGTGQTIGQPCTNCQGDGFDVVKTNEELKIPRGIDNGATLRFKGKGHVNGDLIIKINVRKHPVFRREGNDSHAEKEISVIDAILGTEIQVETIYGQTKKVKVSPGTQNGDKIKMPKEGFFKLNTNEKGSHIVTIKIKVPSKLSNQEKSLYERLKQIAK